MQAITRFHITSSFPIHEEASFAEISNACGLEESVLRRILRHAMTKNIFKEPRKGFVAHTVISRLLAEDAEIHDWVGAITDEFWQAASQVVNALVKYPGSREPNQTVSPSASLVSSGISSSLRVLHLRTIRIRVCGMYSRNTQIALNDLATRWSLSIKGPVTTLSTCSVTFRGILSVMGRS